MTGLDFGFGELLTLSVIFLLYVPFVTVYFLNTLHYFKILTSLLKYVLLGFIFLLFVFAVLLLIRNFHVKSSFGLLFIYSAALTAVIVVRKYVEARK